MTSATTTRITVVLTALKDNVSPITPADILIHLALILADCTAVGIAITKHPNAELHTTETACASGIVPRTKRLVHVPILVDITTSKFNGVCTTRAFVITIA